MIEISTLLSLIFLEIILSVDNLIFVSVISSNLDPKYQGLARFIGVSTALAMRLLLLFFVGALLKIDKVFFSIARLEITYKDIVFIAGGIFLLYKSIIEIIKLVKNIKEIKNNKIFYNGNSPIKKFFVVVLQIIFIDLIFSVDAIIIAVAMSVDMKVIVIATLVSMATLLVSINFLSKILEKYPSIKLLAMVFIAALGVIFILNGLSIPVNKSYLHAALLFCLIFECLDIMRLKNLQERNAEIEE